jgi:tetratricopeptide (TPR) repeat protein
VLGNASLLKRDFKNAIAIFTKMAAQMPMSAVAHERLGTAYAATGDIVKASSELESAFRLDPNNDEYLAALAKLDVQRGASDKAIQRVNQQIANNSGKPTLYDILGQVYLQQKNFNKAEGAFRKSISVDSHRAAAYELLAQSYIAQNRPDRASQELENALKDNPKSVQIRVALGTAYEAQGAADKAIAQYREALKIAPESPVLMNDLAWLLAQTGGNLDEALELVRAANQKLQDNPKILDTTGWIYHKKGAYDTAVNVFKRCVDKAPADANCRYHLGMTYLKSGNVTKAKTALNESIKLDPSFPEAADARKALASLP